MICDILGAPAEQREHFSHWSDSFLDVDRWTKEETRAAHTEFVTCMSELVAAAMGLLVAGHETTAKMVATLLADRTRWERLLADRGLIRTAVEEVLRSDANLGNYGAGRFLTEDVEIDLTPAPNAHLSFGAGPHSYLGPHRTPGRPRSAAEQAAGPRTRRPGRGVAQDRGPDRRRAARSARPLVTPSRPDPHPPTESLPKKGTTMKVSIDEDKCCGAGSCVLAAPEVFDQRDEDGIVVLLDTEPAEDQHPAVRDAAAVCPAAAIVLA